MPVPVTHLTCSAGRWAYSAVSTIGATSNSLTTLNSSGPTNIRMCSPPARAKKATLPLTTVRNLNVGYKVTDWAEVGFNFLLAHTTDEEALHDDYSFPLNSSGDTLEKWQLHFTERQINNYPVPRKS
jgi:hypothetical protein